MSFASYDFLFVFLPISVLLILLASIVSNRLLVVPLVFIISIIFYALSSVPHLILLVGLIFISWLIGKVYVGSAGKRSERTKNLIITLGVLINLSALLVWKYSKSLIELWNNLGLMEVQELSLLMPLGISFYSLQQIGFLLDLRRGRAQAGGLLEYAAFITFFPQLLSGPIVTYRRMHKEFARVKAGIPWKERMNMAMLGIAWFIIGLFKKVFIADNLSRLIMPIVEKSTVTSISSFEALQVALASGPMIYFDFSGYSDMAVGLGLLFGIRLPYNFNAPQRASTNREGWRRWHITFHDFIRDHVYRPLHSRLKDKPYGMVVVFFVVFSVSAFWHGDGPRFIVWGFLTFIVFVLLNQMGEIVSGRSKVLIEKISRYIMVMSLPLIFVTPDLSTTINVLEKVIFFDLSEGTISAILRIAILVFLMVCWSSEISTQVLLNGKKDHPERTFFGWCPPVWSPNILWAFLLSMLLLVSFFFLGASPTFFYYQF